MPHSICLFFRLNFRVRVVISLEKICIPFQRKTIPSNHSESTWASYLGGFPLMLPKGFNPRLDAMSSSSWVGLRRMTVISLKYGSGGISQQISRIQKLDMVQKFFNLNLDFRCFQPCNNRIFLLCYDHGDGDYIDDEAPASATWNCSIEVDLDGMV